MSAEERPLGWRGLLALAVFVFATRAPFLGPGYGLDADAWRLADASRRIAITGDYVISRAPGYPVVEYGGALVWRGGPYALNGLSALACALACVAIAALVARMRPRAALPAALAFAFTPVVYIASTSAMDYLWAVALVMGALCAAANSRPVLAGLAMGLAIGARLPSGVMLAPVALLLLLGPSGARGASIGSALALAIGALTYVPVLAGEGLARLAPARVTWPGFGRALELLGPRSLGWIGTIAVVLALAALALRRGAESPPARAGRSLGAALLLGLALTGAVILWMPYEPGYSVPFVALALPLIAARLSLPGAWLLAAALALSAFVEPYGAKLAPGPILKDHQQRLHEVRQLDRILAAGRALTPAPIVVAGPFLPKLEYLLGSRHDGGVIYLFALMPEQAADLHERGRPLYYIDDIAHWHAEIVGHSLETMAVQPLLGERRESAPQH